LQSALLDALRRQPGGEALLELAPSDAFLVGGAVRDLLLDRSSRELDVVVKSLDAPLGRAAAELAGALAARLGVPGGAVGHERFGTAVLAWEGGRIDIATARRERYTAPGALPEVQAAPLAEDLRRRDFTVNAIAVSLAGAHPGTVIAAEHALEDLQAGRLRVLHERSFLDDPTRLWRLARYRARLGFQIEERTAALAAAAVARGALGTVSRSRVGAELRLALRETDAIGALAALDELGVLAALHPGLRLDEGLAREALGLLAVAEDGPGPAPRPDLLLAATLLQPVVRDLDEDVELELRALLDGMEFPAAERELVLRAAICADALADELARAEAESDIYEAASLDSLEGVALAGARGGRQGSDAGAAARQWLAELRQVRLHITGEDLLAAGVPEGPEIGRRLDVALRAKLDGQLHDGHEAELAAALQLR
jgi:tRNA nucleotidyltransferase (CCA-adding enzyme)